MNLRPENPHLRPLSRNCLPLAGLAALFCSLWLAMPLAGAQEAPQAPTAQEDLQRELAQRVAAQWARTAIEALRAPQIGPFDIEASLRLARAAAELNPDDPVKWRLALKIAMLAEDQQTATHAAQQIAKLDPSDEVVRLIRLQDVVERFQTVEERVAAYERLLEQHENKAAGETLTPAIASRLAFEMALLHRRLGNTAAFAENLARSIELDSGNRKAAAVATGYFRSRITDDPFAEAELLAMMYLADPSDFAAAADLAGLLITNGAYDGAQRIYRHIAQGQTANHRAPADDLLADRAIALWGSGKPTQALDVIRQRQQEINRVHRLRLRAADPELRMNDVGSEEAPVSPSLATVRLAILERTGPSDIAPPFAKSWEHVVLAHEQEVQRLQAAAESREGLPSPDSDIARRYLQLAWLAIWLVEDIDAARSFRDQADERSPLSDTAKQRFEGWFALRAGDLERAASLLQPLAEGDPRDVPSLLGMALVQEKRGQTRDAARSLLQVVRQQAGTVMGVWASERLVEMLGQRVPISDVAHRMNRLIDDIPRVVDRFATNPALGLAVRAWPEKTVHQPFEPVLFNIEVTNNAPFPMAISELGPIRPQLLLALKPSVANVNRLRPPDPIVVDLDRRLRLGPRESMLIQIDLQQTAFGVYLRTFLVSGISMQTRYTWNFVTSRSGALRPGFLGGERRSDLFRIDGIRISGDWISESLNRMNDTDMLGSIDTLERIALLTYIMPTLRAQEQETQQQLETEVTDALADTFTQLDPLAQAWLLGSVRESPLLERMLNAAQQSNDPRVQTAYLLFTTRGPNDAMFSIAQRSDNPLVQTLGRLMQQKIQRQAQREAERNRAPSPRQP